VGGLLFKERCEKRGDGRRLVLDRQLFRRTGQDLKDVVESTRLEIFARADEDRSVAGAPGRCQP
jgi:hypothetical protein